MYGLQQLVERAEQRARMIIADRERCQMVYPVTHGSCYSELCGKRTEFKCTECGISMCRGCVEIVAFEPYCQGCAEEEKVFIAALIRGLDSWYSLVEITREG